MAKPADEKEPVDQAAPAAGDEGVGNADQDLAGGASRGDEQLPDGATAPELSTEQLAAERDKYLEMAQRARADLENYQKRAVRDLQNERKYAVQPLATDLLPVLDNLDRALAAAQKHEQASSGLVEGVQLVQKQLLDAFAKHGIEGVDPIDEPFDPNFHEAVSQQPTAERPPMSVLMTLQKGYKLHDRVIRPAQVIVASAPQDTVADTGDAED